MIASTDNMTVGEYQLAPGSHFEPADVHAGDEIYYVLKGEVTMFQPATGQVVQVKEGEGILMLKDARIWGITCGKRIPDAVCNSSENVGRGWAAHGICRRNKSI